MTTIKKFSFLAVVLSLGFTGARGRADQSVVLTGTIRDQHTSAPVASAHVHLMPGNRQADTNAAGEFSFRVVPGQYEIDIHCRRYMPSVLDVTVDDKLVLPLQIALQRANLDD